MARFMKKPMKIREEWELPPLGFDQPLTFTQTYDGDKGWVKAMGHVSALTGRTLTVFVWDKYIDDSFLHWQEDGYTVRFLGEDKLGAEGVKVVETTSFAEIPSR